MPKFNRDKNYDDSYNSGLYGKDSLDHYNEDLSKKAVGSIFSNIERGDSYDNNQDVEDIVINTNFNVKSDNQRKRLVNDLFDDSDDYEQQKRRPKQARPKQTVMPNRTPVNDANNSALSRDDDTLAVKYVTRGNHQAVTPASVSRRKSVTMMESQRIPIITDEEVSRHKRQTTAKHIAYTSTASQDTAPINYDEFINRNDTTSDQRQILKQLAEEQNQKDLNLENTLYRLNKHNKHYNEVIASTNERLNGTEQNLNSKPVDFDEFNNGFEDGFDDGFDDGFKEGFKDGFIDGFVDGLVDGIEDDFDNQYQDDTQQDFEQNDNQFDLSSISDEDLDRDFEDTLASMSVQSVQNTQNTQNPRTTRNTRNTQTDQEYYTQRSNLEQPKKRKKPKPMINSFDDGDYFDSETDTYVTKKSQYSTGEVRKINNTVATEISIDDLDNFTFNNYDTADMEYLRKTIKEKSKAQKMQSIDNQLQEFEKEHRDFNAKRNIPPKTVPANKSNPNKPNPNNAEQESYEYKKTRLKQDNPTKYDSDSYDNLDTAHRQRQASARHVAVARHATAPVDTDKINRANTTRQASVQTSKIQAVDLHNDDEYDYGDDYSTKFNISLIINIVLIVALLGGGTYLFMSMSSLKEEIETLTTLNDRLVTDSDKITKLQMDVDYYKDLYFATPEGQASLEASNNANNDSSDEDSSDTSSSNNNSNSGSSASGTKYTVATGDTLSSIAKKVYGNSNEYQKIKDANKLTSDNLTVGQELLIP